MPNRKVRIERRKHKRFPVPKDTFVALRPHYCKIGRVENIAMDGLTFTYMFEGKPPGQSFELDIFLVDRTFFLEEVPFRTISDVACHGIPFSSVRMRRTGVQFRDLTPDQKAHLKYFIENHTIGDA